MTPRIAISVEVWIKGLVAAAISGAANGVITGFAAVGIDPTRFNLQSGIKPTLALASVSALMSSLIGTSAYLKQSPLPPQDLSDFDDARSRDEGRLQDDAHAHEETHARDEDRSRDAQRPAGDHHDGDHLGDRPR